MKKYKYLFAAIILCMVLHGFSAQAQKYSSGPNFFPIVVAQQAPYNIQAYKKAGINIYYDLSWGPLDAYHLGLLHDANMYVMCAPDSFARTVMNDTLIYAWTMGDEPDNAQWNPNTNQYDSCIHPSVIINQYKSIKAMDASRPVALNLGQGVANDTWIGRGPCYQWNASYPTYNNGYLSGCDIGSFDIYPVNSTSPGITDNLWYVAKGMDSLLAWSPNSNKPMWAWIETTKISSTSAGKPTPAQVKSEVWMVLIHGAKGIGYFTHTWDPTYISGAVLLDTPMVAGITKLNKQISDLAPVLNSPNITGYAGVRSSNPAVPIDIMTKAYDGYYYIFSVAMRSGNAAGTFTVTSGTSAEVLGENRVLPISGGQFTDNYSSYGVHLYKIQAPTSGKEELHERDDYDINAYPNPTASITNIELPTSVQETRILSVYNISGEKLFEKTIPVNVHTYTIDFAKLPVAPGEYIINVQAGVYNSSRRIMFIGKDVSR